MSLTPKQAEALRLFVKHGEPCHPKLLRINEGVSDRLRNKGFTEPAGFLVRQPSQAGLKALAEYDLKEASKRKAKS